MAGNVQNKEKNAIMKKTTATVLYMRLFVGGFILYLAYSLAQGLGDTKGKDTIILGLFTGIFVLSGLAIVLMCSYKLIKKDYYDPLKDEDHSDEEQSDENRSDEE